MVRRHDAEGMLKGGMCVCAKREDWRVKAERKRLYGRSVRVQCGTEVGEMFALARRRASCCTRRYRDAYDCDLTLERMCARATVDCVSRPDIVHNLMTLSSTAII